MSIRTHLIIYIVFWFAIPSLAQDDQSRQLVTKAEEEYEIGRIESALTMLEDHANGLPKTYRLRAFRLLSLCYLALDRNEEAERYTIQMLKEDPYYTPTVEYPPRFIEIVNKIKRGKTATITTASSQEESIVEVPVPTTLITEEMIRNSGARNLQEVLAAYVPGMHIIDSNDDINIAMRGIYSNSQEKILIMLNGHRLNSYSTNTAAPNFSINLENLKQIEVLRGPASSLYGGVALTAVVNLITKQGNDVDGLEIKASTGNYGQVRGDIIFGKRFYDMDVMVWGSLYRNTGEERKDSINLENAPSTTNKTVTIGRVGDRPSFDMGLQFKWKNLQFLFDTSASQVVPPFTMTTIAAPYLHDEYRTIEGVFPSFYSKKNHFDLSYTHQLGKLNLRGALTYDNNDFAQYQVISDSPSEFLGETLGLPENVCDILRENDGLARYINGQESTMGAQIKGDLLYIDNQQHKGSIAFGAEYSHLKVHDLRIECIYNFSNVLYEPKDLLELGKGYENSYDAFVQLKHKWRSLIFNAGLRYDHKVRYDKTHLNELSPRLALIYIRPKWNMKFSFSKAFVDAPFLYRKTNDFLYNLEDDPENLEDIPTNAVTDHSISPETLNSWQLTFAGTEWVKGLNFELNGFVNWCDNMIVTQLMEYNNSGKNKTIGLELMANYYLPKFTVDFNFTWTHTYTASLFQKEFYRLIIKDSQIDDNNNTPAIMSNVVLTWKPIHNLKLFSHISLEGKQTSYNMDISVMSKATYYLHKSFNHRDDPDMYLSYAAQAMEIISNAVYKGKMNARAIFNIGAEYKLGKFTFNLNVHNLLNTHYYQSGMNTKLVPQKGRWLMGSIAYKF